MSNNEIYSVHVHVEHMTIALSLLYIEISKFLLYFLIIFSNFSSPFSTHSKSG